MIRKHWTAAIVTGVFALAVAGGAADLFGLRPENHAAEVEKPAANTRAAEEKAPAAEAEAAEQKQPEPPAKADAEAEDAAPPPAQEIAKKNPRPTSRPLVLYRWKVPGGAEKDGEGTWDDFAIHQLFFDPSGARLVTVSYRQVHCLDLVSNRVVQSFPEQLPSRKPTFPFLVSPEGRQAPRRPVVRPQKAGRGWRLRAEPLRLPESSDRRGGEPGRAQARRRDGKDGRHLRF
jgi:hypothetical protein